METKYTPGPWWASRSKITGSWSVRTLRDNDAEDSRHVGCDTGAYVCMGVGDHTEQRTSGDTYEANARLIAAAPEMYEALKAAERAAQELLDTPWLPSQGTTLDEITSVKRLALDARDAARAAIAKAEGK